MQEPIDYAKQYQQEKECNIREMTQDPDTARISRLFTDHVGKYKYGYYSSWMGRPIIQLPQDILSMQEIIMKVRPDLILETGIAHGGCTVFLASMLELLGDTDGVSRRVVAVDNDLRPHNREAIEKHPMYRRITLLEGSSVAPEIVSTVRETVREHQTVLVMLDSNHTHSHVLAELNAYGPLVTPGSYLVVFDTNVEFQEKDPVDRPWGKGNNPYTAVQEFLQTHREFVYDDAIVNKSVLTSNPGGWLRRI